MHLLLPFSKCTYFFSQKNFFKSSLPICVTPALHLVYILTFSFKTKFRKIFLGLFLVSTNKVVFKPLSDTFVPTCSKSWSINLINKLFPRSRGCSADAAYQTQFPFSRILRKLWHLGWWRFKRPLINFPFRAILHKFNRIRI